MYIMPVGSDLILGLSMYFYTAAPSTDCVDKGVRKAHTISKSEPRCLKTSSVNYYSR